MMLPLAVNWDNLHALLANVYKDVLNDLLGDMMGVAQGIAGLGALFYIAYRVWKALSNAEPIDVFPLLRPFVIGLCIMFFPTFVLGTVNSVLSPITRACSTLYTTQIEEAKSLQVEKDRLEKERLLRDPSRAHMVDDELFDAKLSELGILNTPEIVMMYADRAAYKFKMWVNNLFRNVLEVIFQAAPLIIDVLRTFFLIVLSILGPLSFALSVYDGFQNSLVAWLARYICIYLWLPVADLFSGILAKIRVLTLNISINELKDPMYCPDESMIFYAVFLIIGIVGYFCVPTVASWIVQAGGAGNYTRRINALVTGTGKKASATAGATVGNVKGKLLG